MSITRLQQARQMYATGQRVAKTLDGSRPGYRGSDMAEVGTDGKQGGVGSNMGPKNTSGADYGGGNQGGGGFGPTGQENDYFDNPDSILTGQDIRDSRRKFEIGVQGGPAYKPLTEFGYKQHPYQHFLDYRPKVNIPNFGLSGMFLNLLNKGVDSPVQKFSDFTTEKNRDFFMNEVLRAGKIPGLNYGTVKDMSVDELESAYKGYMKDRGSGNIDAYGNPIGDKDDNRGIATLYNNNMFNDVNNIVDENIQIASSPFNSRFLQNRSDDVRESIEERMQNYYTI